ncbi:MAG: RluA family pseudouridine synthase [Syntrophobacteraceae bacterium]|nr:RluA family pseudouridine synthase [Syntrophobacteraceae bacterium]
MKNSGYEYREQVEVWGEGLSLSSYLARKYPHSPATVWCDRIKGGEISFDGRKVCDDIFLKPGKRILWRRPPWDEPDAPLTYSVLYEDDDLLVVVKPSGLPTLPSGGFLDHTLLSLVRINRPEASPVHRLGRGTSGALLFACSARARSFLGEALRKNEIIKIYRALATGVPSEQHFSITAPIGPVPHPKLGTLHSVCATGKNALSLVSLIEDRGNTSLLEVRIETGRPHQIRIHLAYAGHPLAGDPLYGAGGAIRDPEALPGDCGYLLHAERLTFCHPVAGSPIDIYCSPPPELSAPPS